MRSLYALARQHLRGSGTNITNGTDNANSIKGGAGKDGRTEEKQRAKRGGLTRVESLVHELTRHSTCTVNTYQPESMLLNSIFRRSEVRAHHSTDAAYKAHSKYHPWNNVFNVWSYYSLAEHSQGLADMILNAKPDRNIDRAANAVNKSPVPVYLNVSLRSDLSAAERGSLVCLFRNPSVSTAAPATPPEMMAIRFQDEGLLS